MLNVAHKLGSDFQVLLGQCDVHGYEQHGMICVGSAGPGQAKGGPLYTWPSPLPWCNARQAFYPVDDCSPDLHIMRSA